MGVCRSKHEKTESSSETEEAGRSNTLNNNDYKGGKQQEDSMGSSTHRVRVAGQVDLRPAAHAPNAVVSHLQLDRSKTPVVGLVSQPPPHHLRHPTIGQQLRKYRSCPAVSTVFIPQPPLPPHWQLKAETVPRHEKRHTPRSASTSVHTAGSSVRLTADSLYKLHEEKSSYADEDA